MKKALKVALIAIICIFAVFCIDSLKSCFWFNEDCFGLYAKIGVGIIGIGVFVVLVYIWSFWSDFSKYREREKDSYIFSFKKQTKGFYSDNRFISGESISSFMEEYHMGEYFFYDFILGLGLRNQMEWYGIIRRYQKAKNDLTSCSIGTEGWKDAQQELERVKVAAEDFVNLNYNLNSDL